MFLDLLAGGGLLAVYSDSYTVVVAACERGCRHDVICAPVIAATELISNRELGGLFPYSLQVTLIWIIVAVINSVATIDAERMLGVRLGAITVLELRGLNFYAGPILN